MTHLLNNKNNIFFRGSTLSLVLTNFSPKNPTYVPGDHLGVLACNNSTIVQEILEKLSGTVNFDSPVELQVQKQIHTPNGEYKFYFCFFLFLIFRHRLSAGR